MECLLSYFSRKLTYIFAISQDFSADLKSLNVNSSDRFIIKTFWPFDAKKHPIVKHRAVLPDPVSNYIMCLPLRLLEVQKLKHKIWRGRGLSIPTEAKNVLLEGSNSFCKLYSTKFKLLLAALISVSNELIFICEF